MMLCAEWIYGRKEGSKPVNLLYEYNALSCVRFVKKILLSDSKSRIDDKKRKDERKREREGEKVERPIENDSDSERILNNSTKAAHMLYYAIACGQ